MAPDSKRSPALPDHFLHPDNLELSDRLTRQIEVDVAQEKLSSDLWTERELTVIQTQLRTWLLTKDIQHLETLLKQVPTSIAHPVVFRQLAYLRELQSYLDEDDLEAMNEDLEVPFSPEDFDDPILPAGAKQTALKALVRLTSVWVGPWIPLLISLPEQRRYTLQPPKPAKKRRGRPRQHLDLYFLSAFYECREQLKKHGKKYFQPTHKERRTAFFARIAAAVQKLDVGMAGIINPSPVDILRLVRSAFGQRRIRLDPLIFHFLAKASGHSPGQVRGFVQRGEEAYPHLHLRRARAERW